MHRRIWTTGAIAVLALAPMTALAAADETKAVEQEVLKRIKITPTKVESLAVKKVFAATFYKVKIGIKDGDSTSTSELSLARNQGKFVSIESTTTTRKMPVLQSVVKKDFKLKSEADAKVFQEALDKLYPVRGFGDDGKAKAIKKTASGWTFVRGTFFKDLKGFVVTTDASGVIKTIDYSLGIKK
jgi:hypothetical protein